MLPQNHVQLNHSHTTAYGDLDNQNSSQSTLGGRGLTVSRHSGAVQIQRKPTACTEDRLPAAGLVTATLTTEGETAIKL